MNLRSRVTKLECYRMPRPPYVVRVSHPPTPLDAEAVAAARRQGHSFAIVPFKAASVAEWQAQHEVVR